MRESKPIITRANVSILLTSGVLIFGSWLLKVNWMGTVVGVILVVNAVLNLFQQLLTDEEIDRQARALVRLFIKLKISKSKEKELNKKEKLTNLLKNTK